MALENSSPEAIAEYLNEITTERMGMDSRIAHDLSIAKLVLSVKENCLS